MAQFDTYRLAVIGTGSAAQELVNVYHYRQTTVAGGDDGTDLIDAWTAELSADYAALISNQCAIVGFECRNLTQPDFGVDYTLPVPVQGTKTGDQLPPQTSAIISWRTGFIGRRRRGRTFVWPTSETEQSAGQWISTYISQLSGFATDAQALIGALGSYQLVIYSQPNTDPPPTPAILITPVNSAVIPSFTGSQRRRRVGVGS